eukprot:CAMPEP_0171302508 /NCGR_PEP_ID=MMETSP0816-20121228/11911_1 /TAXON_ID=420281 /ORGANISM="Proboscia inermis, Strain CCAP1064/1" /LENGTH=43 /DNA_ID= /DNA_START= /DNA_END= /DNA_ORIENTATION=
MQDPMGLGKGEEGPECSLRLCIWESFRSWVMYSSSRAASTSSG